MRKLYLNVFAISCVCVSVSGQDQDFSKVQMKVSKVAGNTYMLEGAGGNIGASVGEDGVVIVDDQAPLAEKIQAALKSITDKPLRFIINTHYHFDHTGGNAFFQKQAPISLTTMSANGWRKAAPREISVQSSLNTNLNRKTRSPSSRLTTM